MVTTKSRRNQTRSKTFLPSRLLIVLRLALYSTEGSSAKKCLRRSWRQPIDGMARSDARDTGALPTSRGLDLSIDRSPTHKLSFGHRLKTFKPILPIIGNQAQTLRLLYAKGQRTGLLCPSSVKRLPPCRSTVGVQYVVRSALAVSRVFRRVHHHSSSSTLALANCSREVVRGRLRLATWLLNFECASH